MVSFIYTHTIKLNCPRNLTLFFIHYGDLSSLGPLELEWYQKEHTPFAVGSRANGLSSSTEHNLATQQQSCPGPGS